ncbi:MAG: hypothetical protein KF761_02635 [Salinibacterium sp.]|nr:hypothetical protein [Salinibacterium sp.]
MYDFMIVGVALALALPITAAAIVGLAFALFARAGGMSPLAGTTSLQMNGDGTLTEVAVDDGHILAA